MCEACKSQRERDKAMWLTFRRAILMIAKAIESRYAETQERRAA